MGNNNSDSSTSSDSKHHPLNIFICGNLLNLFIDTRNSNQELFDGYDRYIHSELGWYFTSITDQSIKNLLTKSIDDCDPIMANTVILFQDTSILTERVAKLINGINSLSTLYHPFIIFISSQEESKEDLIAYLHKYTIDIANIDLRNFYTIQLIGNDIREIYMRLFKISSYYHQLGDELSFPMSVNVRNLLDEKDAKEDTNIANKIQLFENNFGHRLNFMVMGRPGGGKSALINQLFGEKRCLEKAGKSVTTKIVKYNHPTYPLAIFDTPGFEDENNMETIFNTIQQMNKKLSEQLDVIHLMIYVLNSQDERTLYNTEEKFITKINSWLAKNYDTDVINEILKRKIPFIFVLTHSQTPNHAKNKSIILNHTLRPLFKDYENNYEILSVELFATEKGNPFGMDTLFGYLYGYFLKDYITPDIIEGITKADPKDDETIFSFVKQSRLLSKIQSKEDIKKYCRYIAGGIISSTSLLAVAIGASPIPFADWFILTSIQIGMVISIGAVYGLVFDKNKAKEIIGSLAVSGASSGICRGIASGIKAIPGIGTITGIIIDSIVSALGTSGIGYATCKICEIEIDKRGIQSFYLDAIKNFNFAIDSLLEIKNKYTQ